MKQSSRQLAFVCMVVAMAAGCADQAQQPSDTTPATKAPSGTLVAPGVADPFTHSLAIFRLVSGQARQSRVPLTKSNRTD